MANRYRKRCPTSLAIREMQNKTVMRHPSFLLEWLSLTSNDKCCRGCREKGTLTLCWWECRLVQPLWTTVWQLLKKIRIELPHEPPTPVPCETFVLTHPYVHDSIIHGVHGNIRYGNN